MWPCSRQRKHLPSLANCALSSGVSFLKFVCPMVLSTSIRTMPELFKFNCARDKVCKFEYVPGFLHGLPLSELPLSIPRWCEESGCDLMPYCVSLCSSLHGSERWFLQSSRPTLLLRPGGRTWQCTCPRPICSSSGTSANRMHFVFWMCQFTWQEKLSWTQTIEFHCPRAPNCFYWCQFNWLVLFLVGPPNR